MKKGIAVLMLILISSLNSIAQDNASGRYEKRSSKPFHNINIKGELKVKLIRSDDPLVVVNGNPFQFCNTITMLRSDTLFVYLTNVRLTDAKVKVLIYTDGIELLDVNGKTTVDCSGFNNDIISVRTKNGAQVRLKADVPDKSIVNNNSPYDRAAYYAFWTP